MLRMWLKQCHKLPMTGNGKHTTYLWLFNHTIYFYMCLYYMFIDLYLSRYYSWDFGYGIWNDQGLRKVKIMTYYSWDFHGDEWHMATYEISILQSSFCNGGHTLSKTR